MTDPLSLRAFGGVCMIDKINGAVRLFAFV